MIVLAPRDGFEPPTNATRRGAVERAAFSLIDLVAVKDFLEDQLARRVDVVTRGPFWSADGIDTGVHGTAPSA